MSSKKPTGVTEKPKKGFSRRGFLRGVGVSGGAIGAGVLEREAEAAQPAAAVHGPGEVAITLRINGKAHSLSVEPRLTLLDALRDRLNTTGAKRACDRFGCGACTVLMSGKAVYACSVLAIDAQGKEIQTIEGLAAEPRTRALINAFVEHDGQQCGYCTPGFVVAAKAFLDRNPSPTEQQVRDGLGGNLCRCGSYMGIRKAVVGVSRQTGGAKNA